jgi:hypothetical protein
MRIEDFLSRLKKVRKTGANNWIACCPAHDDKNPSMTVGIGDNQGIIIHCFPGCSPAEIVWALGLELHELMPERPLGREYVAGRARPFPAADVLEAVANDAFYVAYMAATMEQGHKLTPTDKALLGQAYERITEARRIALGER